ncbi:hypothetical protein JCM1840_005620 [Sporobolomyces johnsonii]
MTTAYAPSPSKKPTYAPTPAPLADPTDLRGSLAALGRTGYEDMISWRARESRAAVSRGPIVGTSSSSTLSHPLSTRRPLGFSRTEPVLSFAPISRPTSIYPTAAAGSSATNSAFQTTQDIINVVYSDGRRADELRPMWETVAASRDDFGLGLGRSGEGQGSVGTMELEHPGAADGDGDGDGFDLDEALGPSSSKLSFGAFGAPPAESSLRSEAQAGALSPPSRRTKKRAFEDVAAAVLAPGDADEEMMMARTDVEDEGFEGEGSDEPAPLGFLAGPAGRRVVAAGARGFARTQSLPASAFSGQMEF